MLAPTLEHASRRPRIETNATDFDELVPEEEIAAVIRDLKYGVRQLLSRPGWTLSMVLVLGLGIGANTGMFSGFEAWVLRPLDFDDPERLVAVSESQPAFHRFERAVSPRALGDWSREALSFSEMGAYSRANFNLGNDVEVVRVFGARVTSSLFPMLGKQPILGRTFTQEDDLPGAARDVALISHQIWEQRYAGDPQVVGREIRVDGRVREIVGVMEEGFAFPEWSDVWTPLGLELDEGPRDQRWLDVIARLAPHASIETAQTELSALAERTAGQFPETNRGWSVHVQSLREAFVPPVITLAISASLAMGIFVLLVICANVAGLMLARASARTREYALRTALGASPGRLVRQNIIEAMLLAVPGGLLGAWIGSLTVRWQLELVPVDPPYLFSMGFSYSAALYTLAVAVFAGFVCALAPVARTSRFDVQTVLRSGGARGGSSRSAVGLRRLLIVGELAISTALLIAAFLMVKSVLVGKAQPLGYEVDGVLVAELSLVGSDYEAQGQKSATVERLMAALAGQAEFEAPGITSRLPVSMSNAVVKVEAEGRNTVPGEEVEGALLVVSRGYFDALGLEAARGRLFSRVEEVEGAPVAIVSEGLARELWGSIDVVGRRLQQGAGAERPLMSVVGVVPDVRPGQSMVDFGDQAKTQLYVPFATNEVSTVTVLVTTETPLPSAAGRLRGALASALPGVPVGDVLSMAEAVDRVEWVGRLFSQQFTVYALLATLIALVGLYGLTADSIVRRMREMAIRTALGASPRDLLQMVLARVLALAIGGVGLGVLFALLVTRLGASMLQGVSARDPAVFSVVVALLLGATVIAGYVPARRAVRVDPSSTLRSE